VYVNVEITRHVIEWNMLVYVNVKMSRQVMERDMLVYVNVEITRHVIELDMLVYSDRTDLSTESGSGPIQLARDRYRTACRSVAESPPHCMNAPQQAHVAH